MRKPDRSENDLFILAVSGGPDSVYLAHRMNRSANRLLLAHFNHRARGKESEEDQEFVERLGRSLGIPVEVGKKGPGEPAPRALSTDHPSGTGGFERAAREARYDFLKKVKREKGALKVLVAHTADDQVETVLMRILEGAGISGLKGIPRNTPHGIWRPLLDIWREEILTTLRKRKIPYRIDRSNRDTRFERNWIRLVLIPLLEKRYGKSVRRRIFALGERFRELDSFVEEGARNWLRNRRVWNSGRKRTRPPEAVAIPRAAFAALPSVLRMRVLQILCFEHLGTSPNERLLRAMETLVLSGGPSGRMDVGKGAAIRCRYDEALLTRAAPKRSPGKGSPGAGGKSMRPPEKRKGRIRGEDAESGKPVVRMEGPGEYSWKWAGKGGPFGGPSRFSWRPGGRPAQEKIRRLAAGERQAVFDAAAVSAPLFVRPLRAGDRIRPFGLGADKKVKEILIDRKVPREERWGRPVVCDASGEILWIPGVVRSAHAPVTRRTGRTVVLRSEIP